jgi:hypothetical protein
MIEAAQLAFLLTFSLALGVFMATGRLFKPYWLMLLRHHWPQIGAYATGLFVFLWLGLARLTRGRRSLRMTGTKLRRTERELRRDGWLTT